MLQYLVFVGAAVNLLGSSWYIARTLKGTTKPNRVTFFIWGLAPMISVTVMVSEGVGWAALPVFMSGFIPFVIFLTSFVNKRAYWKLGKLDYVCGALSLLALVLWLLSRDPFVAIALAIASDALAGWPTIVKIWRYPETEHWSAYGSGLVNACTAFFAIESFTFAAVAFPIYLVIVICVTLLGFVIPWFRSKPAV